jgi:hypothetical protein
MHTVFTIVFTIVFAHVLLLTACTDSEPVDSGEQRTPGADQTVTAFDAEHVYYGDENRRSVDVQVTLPDESTTYSSITGRFALTCPNDKCDHWDRYGTVGIVLDPGTDDETYVELDRFITAYRVGFDWSSDLTAYRALLTGTVTLRVFIDTWVGPGHAQGEGWLFDVALDYLGGPPPENEVRQVVPVWPHLSYSAGLEDNPVGDQVLPVEVPVTSASQVTLRSFISGHGWNNSENCAEFCAKDHSYGLGDGEWDREVWRDDCEDTVTDGTQQGTWEYDRAGWCPGAQVYPWDMDVTEHWTGDSASVSYALEPFVWSGSGDQPYYYMSGVLLVADGPSTR